ncbi:hypothetical protein DBY73_010560 [Enterobacter sp. RIT418]|nr:hypothetical protein DBY73_010560 [Enterobacter sp. RIT 418]
MGKGPKWLAALFPSPCYRLLREFILHQWRFGSNKSVYNYGRNVHIDYLHSVTLSVATAI